MSAMKTLVAEIDGRHVGYPTSYWKAEAIIRDTRRRKLKNNTTLHHYPETESYAIRLHATDVVVFESDGSVTLDTGGWQTVTTKDRMNEALCDGWGIYQEKRVWYLQKGHDGQRFAYADGMSIEQDGSVMGEGVDPKVQLKLKKDAKAFAKAYMVALLKGDVPAPDGGDCWHCIGLAQPTARSGSGHILSHIEEKYYVPSLIVRAVERFPVSQVAMWVLDAHWGSLDAARAHAYGGIGSAQLEKALFRYVCSQVGLAS